MEAKILNFMGCKSATLQASPIALIAGRNYQGKSSALRAISAALSANPLPLGLKKQDSKLLISLNATEGKVSLRTEKGTANILYPKAELVTDGELPASTPIAAGVTSPVEMGAKELIEYIRTLLAAEPTYNELKEALSAAGMDENIIKALWASIEREGWGATYRKSVEKGREYKGNWGYVTGEAYGSHKGEGWKPIGWSLDLEQKDEESLAKELSEANAALEKAIAEKAVAMDERAKLTAKAKTLTGIREKYAETQNACAIAKLALDNAISEANKTTEKLPRGYETVGDCPKCKARLGVINGVFEVALNEGSAEERKRAREIFDKYEVRVTAAGVELSRLEGELGKLKEAGDEAKKAEAELKNTPQDAGKTIDIKREAVATATKRLEIYRKEKEASRLHRLISDNQAIVDALDERGLRHKAMLRGIEVFNSKLSEVSELCRWGRVELTTILDFLYTAAGGCALPYTLLSASEQYRVRVTLQIASALLDKSQAVVIDALDILDNEGRKSLLSVLAKQPFVSFVGVTANSIDKVPNLSKIGVGNTYWAEAGNIS
jgi:hypothetical protein